MSKSNLKKTDPRPVEDVTGFKREALGATTALTANSQEGDLLTYRVALVTAVGYREGWIARRTTTTSPVYTPGEYAALGMPEGKRRSDAWLTMIRRLAACSTVGLNPTDHPEEWAHVVQKSSAKRIVEALGEKSGQPSETATLDSLVAAIRADRAERDQKSEGDQKNGQSSRKGKAQPEGKGKGTPDAKSATMGDLAAVLTDPEHGKNVEVLALAVKIISARLKHATDAQSADIQTRLGKVFSADNALRAKTAADAEKKSA